MTDKEAACGWRSEVIVAGTSLSEFRSAAPPGVTERHRSKASMSRVVMTVLAFTAGTVAFATQLSYFHRDGIDLAFALFTASPFILLTVLSALLSSPGSALLSAPGAICALVLISLSTYVGLSEGSRGSSSTAGILIVVTPAYSIFAVLSVWAVDAIVRLVRRKRQRSTIAEG